MNIFFKEKDRDDPGKERFYFKLNQGEGEDKGGKGEEEKLYTIKQ